MTVIGVVGYGIVGKAVAKGFKEKGFIVHVNEVNLNLLPIMNKKRESIIPIINHSKKYLLDTCDVAFICVGTPPNSNGRINDGYLLHALNEFQDIYDTYKPDKTPVFVIKSTVLPGTTKALEEAYPWFRFAVNPEFLRSNYAEKDFLKPDRIIMGTNDDSIKDMLWELYDSWSCHKIMTTSTGAELIKHLSNAFLLTKITFACEMQRLCQHYFIDDMVTVYEGVTSDHRIEKSHLNPLLGRIRFDSPCLPKDLLALIHGLEDDGVDTSFLQAIFDGGVQL